MFMRKIFSKILIGLLGAVLIFAPALSANANFAAGDITDYGWATDHNRDVFVTTVSNDLTAFQTSVQANAIVDDYVPIEAKVGMAFMNGMSLVAKVLETSLVRFAIMFIVIMYLFWAMLEAYNMMTTGGDARKTVEDILKKALLVCVWIYILSVGVADVFMWVMGPIVSIGTYFSDVILNAVTSTAGVSLPDTCGAIHQYVATHVSPDMLLESEAAANIMCVPTRLSGFFYTAIAAGFKWMISGIGTNAFTCLMGATFVVVFTYNAIRFALSALGVIADLFLAVMMLPFTAVTETVGKSNYKGIVGDVFNGFMGLFNAETLDAQIGRFINASIYFISLSVVIAICAALMSGVVTADLVAAVPSMTTDGFWPALLIGLLVAYLANKSSEIAQSIGGKINDKIGIQMGQDAAGLASRSIATAKDWWKAWRQDKQNA